MDITVTVCLDSKVDFAIFFLRIHIFLPEYEARISSKFNLYLLFFQEKCVSSSLTTADQPPVSWATVQIPRQDSLVIVPLVRIIHIKCFRENRESSYLILSRENQSLTPHENTLSSKLYCIYIIYTYLSCVITVCDYFWNLLEYPHQAKKFN